MRRGGVSRFGGRLFTFILILILMWDPAGLLGIGQLESVVFRARWCTERWMAAGCSGSEMVHAVVISWALRG